MFNTVCVYAYVWVGVCVYAFSAAAAVVDNLSLSLALFLALLKEVWQVWFITCSLLMSVNIQMGPVIIAEVLF